MFLVDSTHMGGFAWRTYNGHSARRFSDNTRGYAAKIAAQPGASPCTNHNVVDAVMLGIVDELAGWVG